jgi:hypothetical protein
VSIEENWATFSDFSFLDKLFGILKDIGTPVGLVAGH